VMEILATLTNSALILATIGLSSALNKCYHRDCSDEEERKMLTGTVIWILTPTSLIIAASGVVLAGPLAQLLLGDRGASDLVALSLVSAGLFTLSQIPLTLLRSQERSVPYSILSLWQFLAMTGLNIWLVGGLRLGVKGVLLGSIGSAASVLVVSLVFLVRQSSFRFSPRLARALLRFGLPMVPVAIGGWIMNVSDRWMLALLTDQHQVGLYGLGYRIGMMVQFLLVMPFQLAWPAFYFREAARSDARELYARVVTQYFAVGGLITLAVTLGGEIVVRIMADPAYWPGATIIPLVALAYFLNGCQYAVAPGVHLGGKTHLMPAVAGLGAVSNIILNLLWIPRYGMVGAAWATVLAFMVVCGLTALVSRKAYGFRFETGSILTIVSVLSLLGAAGLLLHTDSLPVLCVTRGFILLIASIWLLARLLRDLGFRPGTTREAKAGLMKFLRAR